MKASFYDQNAPSLGLPSYSTMLKAVFYKLRLHSVPAERVFNQAEEEGGGSLVIWCHDSCED